MADLADSTALVNDIETAQNAPVSEATIQKVGGGINSLLNRMDDVEGRLGNGTTLLSFTYTPGSSQNVDYAIGSVTFTGRPYLVVVQPGNSITASSTHTAIIKDSTGTLISAIHNSYNTGFVTYVASHTAGTYTLYIRAIGTSLFMGGSISIAFIELP